MRTTALAKLVLVAAALGGALYLFLGSRMGGGAASLDQNRSGPAAPASVEGAHAADRTSAHLSSSSDSALKFRFGFLEFEDGPDARPE